jgi:hypothetical protein
MKNRIRAVLCVALLSLSLGACSATDFKNGLAQAAAQAQEIWDTINTGVNFALGQIPTICSVAFDAHAQFRNAAATFHFSQKVLTGEARAVAALSVVCNNPPATLADAIARFKPAYQAFKSAQAEAAAEVSAAGQ